MHACRSTLEDPTAGLEVVSRKAIHHATNLLPSVVLHEPRPAPGLRRAFSILRVLDKGLASAWPFWRLGCSVIYCLERP